MLIKFGRIGILIIIFTFVLNLSFAQVGYYTCTTHTPSHMGFDKEKLKRDHKCKKFKYHILNFSSDIATSVTASLRMNQKELHLWIIDDRRIDILTTTPDKAESIKSRLPNPKIRKISIDRYQLELFKNQLDKNPNKMPLYYKNKRLSPDIYTLR